MHTRVDIRHRRWLLFVVPLILGLVLALSACGTNVSTTTGAAPSGSTTTTPGVTATSSGVNATTPGVTATAPGATATSTQSQARANGCPNDTVVTAPLPTANVVLTNANSGTTVKAKKGDTIEVKLSFGHIWQGPTDLSQDLLTAQGPAGYAYPSAKFCVWRFLAAGTGSAHLSFEGRPICKPTQACPMYIMAVPFTIDIA